MNTINSLITATFITLIFIFFIRLKNKKKNNLLEKEADANKKFYEIYNQLDLSNFKQKKFNPFSIISYICMVFSIWSVIFITIPKFRHDMNLLVLCFLYPLVIWTICIIVSYSHQKDREKKYLENILPQFIKLYNSNYSFEALSNHDFMIEEYYNNAEFTIYNLSRNSYYSTSLINGYMPNQFSITQIFTNTPMYTPADGVVNSSVHFYSSFFTLKLPVKIQSPIYIRKKLKDQFPKYRPPFENLKQNFSIPEFEKKYLVYSENNELVQKLLSQELVDYLLKLNIKIELTLKDDNLYIQIFPIYQVGFEYYQFSNLKLNLYRDFDFLSNIFDISEKIISNINNL